MWAKFIFFFKITCLFTQKCQRASIKSLRSLKLAQLPSAWKFLLCLPPPIVVDFFKLNFILLLNSILKWSDIKVEEETEIFLFYLFILFHTYIKTTGKVFTRLISKIYLDIILHLAALLSVYKKEYPYINNKHKKSWEESFSCLRPKL